MTAGQVAVRKQLQVKLQVSLSKHRCLRTTAVRKMALVQKAVARKVAVVQKAIARKAVGVAVVRKTMARKAVRKAVLRKAVQVSLSLRKHQKQKLQQLFSLSCLRKAAVRKTGGKAGGKAVTRKAGGGMAVVRKAMVWKAVGKAVVRKDMVRKAVGSAMARPLGGNAGGGMIPTERKLR